MLHSSATIWPISLAGLTSGASIIKEDIDIQKMCDALLNGEGVFFFFGSLGTHKQ